MKNYIDFNKHILVSNGGTNFDKRTSSGKDLIKRIKHIANYDGDMPKNLLGLRMKDIDILFTTKNINLN